MDIKKWIKEEIERGEDIEVIKGAVEILGFDKKLVDEVLKELKKSRSTTKKISASKKTKKISKKDVSASQIQQSKQNIKSQQIPVKENIALAQQVKEEKSNTLQTVQQQTPRQTQPIEKEKDIKSQEKEEVHYLKEEPIEILEFHVPREIIEHHEKQTKQIKRYVVYLLMFVGISLIILGAYLFYYIRR
ncbi:MAG: hypothetical protein GXN99_02630 [Candidatus Nanohaloarchaeota archaeon]|nr:hypothetical protein [Candidatus Nanohaloarchaeota archaeon]